MRAAPPTPLTVRHRPWPVALATPRMGTGTEARADLVVTNRYLRRAGRPWIPISGELHYSRVPRHRWTTRLRQMRAGGVTVVATYVFWIHHVEHRGEPRFNDNLDIAAFVDACHATGLEVVLRIGPWAHGETRNGGLPDWVQRAPVEHRTDDPAYLAMVREWFGQPAGDHGMQESHATGYPNDPPRLSYDFVEPDRARRPRATTPDPRS